jgi:hypothetical protein
MEGWTERLIQELKNKLLILKMREKGPWMTQKMMGILMTEQDSDFYRKKKNK